MRNGGDARLSSAQATYREMLLQCARDYAGLPDARTLSIGEIVFFYDGLRPELRKHTRPAPEAMPGKSSKPSKPHTSKPPSKVSSKQRSTGNTRTNGR